MCEIPVSPSEFWTLQALPLKSAVLAILTIAAVAGVIVYSWQDAGKPKTVAQSASA